MNDPNKRAPLFERLKTGLEECIEFTKGNANLRTTVFSDRARDPDTEMTADKFDTRLLTGIRVALLKARELGYPVERMDVSASVAEGLCSVHFTPLPDPTTITTGGDLSLTVDPDSEEITSIERGQ